VKNLVRGAAAILAVSVSLTACGSSAADDARTQACRSWSVNGASAATSMLDLARTDTIDTPTGNALVQQLHDEFGVIAGIDGLSDADFKPFADAAKVFPSTSAGIFDIGPAHPSTRGAAQAAVAAINKLCG
jgi:hypothetical protein